MRGLGVYRGQC